MRERGNAKIQLTNVTARFQKIVFFFTMAQQPPEDQGLLIIEDSLSHSMRNTIIGRTALDEWPARRRDLYLTAHYTHNRDIHAPGGIRTTIPGRKRPQTHALDRATTGTSKKTVLTLIKLYAK